MIERVVRWFYEPKIQAKEKEIEKSSRSIENLLNKLEKKDKEIREMNDWLQGLLNSQIDLLVFIDLDNNITFANSAYRLTFGLTDEDIEQGFCFKDLIHPDDLEDSQEHWEKLKYPPFRTRHIQRAYTANEGYRWFEWEAWVLFDNSGKRKGMAGSARDVTERILAEKERQRVLDDYATLLNSIPVYVWYVPDPEHMGQCNRAFAEFFGIDDCDELVGAELTDIMPQEQVNICLEANHKVFNEGIVVTTEEWVTRHDGVDRLWRITKTPKMNGKVKYAVACGVDITDWNKCNGCNDGLG